MTTVKKKYILKNELEKLCEEPVLKDKIKNSKDAKEVRKIIKEILSDNQDVTEVSVKSYMKKWGLPKSTNTDLDKVKEDINEANTEGLDKEGENKEDIDNENEEKIELETANKKKLDEEIQAKRRLEEANQKILGVEIKEKKKIEVENKKKLDEEIEAKRRLEKLLEAEKITGKTEEEVKAIYLYVSLLKEKDTLKAENKNLIDENDSLKNQNELLKQKLEKSNAERGIKEDFTSKIPSLNEIASSEDKTSVFINKEILVKATKYVDAHCLVRLESVIINGYDLNSAIVQSVLLEFILQNSLL